MAVKNSTSLSILIGGTAILHQLDASISINREAFNVTTKDSPTPFEEFQSGAINGTMSLSGLYADGDLDPLTTPLLGDGSTVTAKWGNATSGEEYYTADAIVTSIEKSAPGYEQASTYNATLQLTGAITKADNA